MNKALLIVSFGTSHSDTRALTLTAIERDLAAAFPERLLLHAFTSRMIASKIERETGEHVPSIDEALASFEEQGVRDVLVQPTHLMQGAENSKMLDLLAQAPSSFESLRVGETLLATADDCRKMAQAVIDAFPKADGEMTVLMGHGSEVKGNEVYGTMNSCFAALGRDDIVVATVEGEPDFSFALDAVSRRSPGSVVLAPFMIVAGDHAKNDLAGDDADSWESRLAADGFKTRAVLRGLGEYPAVRALIVEHARRAEETE